MTGTRKTWLSTAALLALVTVLSTTQTATGAPAAGGAHPAPSCAATPGPSGRQAREIVDIVRKTRRELGLKAALVKVTVDGREVVTTADGEALASVPVTPDRRFRAGGVAIGYLSTILLQLVDEGRADLDTPVSRWLPEMRYGDRITLRMLASSTSGLYDYVPDPGFLKALHDDPFRPWTSWEFLGISLRQPLRYTPGTNWNYSHANFRLLGAALEKITGTRLDKLLRERIVHPLGLRATTNSFTPEMPGPVVHAFSNERGIHEESTYWNPSWTLHPGSVLSSDVCDMARSAEAIGSGELISKKAYRTLLDPGTVGKGGPTATCPATVCRAQTEASHYGLGMVVKDGWVFQNPLFSGYGETMAYLPGKKVAIAVATTIGPSSPATNTSETVASRIAAVVAPGHPLFG